MASIYKRGRIWWIEYTINGRRIQKSLKTTSARFAKLAKHDIELKIAKQQIGFPIEYRICDWEKEFFRHAKAHLRPATVERYRESLTWFLQFLDRLPERPIYLSEITPQMIEDFKIERLSIVKKKTVNNDLGTIRRFFNLAIKRGYLDKNPMEKVEMLKISDRKLPRFLAKEELERIYVELRDEDRDIVKVLANTGMRWGALRHLEWKDVDMENRIIKIREKILHTGKMWKPKAGSARDIPMNDVVYEILKKRKRTEGFVFSKRDGKILDRNNLRERLQRVCRKLGIENVTIHTLRHTFCSHLIMSGVDIPTMMKLSGHKDIRVAQMYMHLAKDHVRKAVERIKL